jgi:hypothetical protein
MTFFTARSTEPKDVKILQSSPPKVKPASSPKRPSASAARITTKILPTSSTPSSTTKFSKSLNRKRRSVSESQSGTEEKETRPIKKVKGEKKKKDEEKTSKSLDAKGWHAPLKFPSPSDSDQSEE